MATKNLLNKVAPDGALKELLPQLFKTYPNLSKTLPSSYFLYRDDGKFEKYFVTYCHSYMSYEKPGWEHLVTAVPKADEVSIDYLKMLITGPFKAVGDLIFLEQQDGLAFLRCAQLDKWPANLLYNFCIASRVPIEFPHYLERWQKLVEEGYDKTLAFLLSYSTNGEVWKKDNDRSFPAKNHLWFDSNSDWRKIIEGSPVALTPPYKEFPQGSRPTNIIWSKWDGVSGFAFMSDEEVSNFLGLPIQVIEVPKKRRTKSEVIQDIINMQVEIGMEAAAEGPQPAPPPQWVQNLHMDLPQVPWGFNAPLNPVEADDDFDEDDDDIWPEDEEDDLDDDI